MLKLGVEGLGFIARIAELEFMRSSSGSCFECSSKNVVTSVRELPRGRCLGWMCKKCYDNLVKTGQVVNYLFGYEGFVD
jgi:hypothetical protein